MSLFTNGMRHAPANVVYAAPAIVAVPSTVGGVDLIAAAASAVAPRHVRIFNPAGGENIFVTFDATVPTTANGRIVAPGDELVLTTAQRVRAICAAGPVNVHVLSGTYV